LEEPLVFAIFTANYRKKKSLRIKITLLLTDNKLKLII
jgi:hypothetical protein